MNAGRMTRGLPVAAAAAVAAASLLPWARTGQIRRSGYALAIAARQAGLTLGSWETAVVGAWLSLPLLAALCLAATTLGRPAAAPVFSALTGTVGLLCAITVLQSSVGREPGVWAGITTSAIALMVAGWTHVRSRE